MTFSPDSRSIASAGRDGVVRVWDASTGAAISSLASHEDWVTELAFSPDGKRIASLRHRFDAQGQRGRKWPRGRGRLTPRRHV